MSLSATSRSMGYTVFWQAAQVSFTWARRLKDCGETLSLGPAGATIPSPARAALSSPYLGTLDSAGPATPLGFLQKRVDWSGCRCMHVPNLCSPHPYPHSRDTQAQSLLCSPGSQHPSETCGGRVGWWGVTYVRRGGGLGGSRSLEHGSRRAMQAPLGPAKQSKAKQREVGP